MSSPVALPLDGRQGLAPPTLWGLRPDHLHDRYWAARGVQVVRQGEPSEILDGAELFLLTAPRVLVLFPLRDLAEALSWLQPEVLFLRLRDDRERGYRELVRTTENGEFLGIQRVYRGTDARQARVVLTPDRGLARIWQNAPDPRAGWLLLRDAVRDDKRAVRRARGRTYDRSNPQDVMDCLQKLLEIWDRPDATIDRVRRQESDLWVHETATAPRDTRVFGSVWIGAGRALSPTDVVAGPAILWDDPAARPEVIGVQWQEIEPLAQSKRIRRVRGRAPWRDFGRRVFDFVFALIAILLTLPLYPFVMLAILLEDGWPFFFAHRRETLGGREFPCLKFRSMKKNADEVKAQLAGENQADGPQFFIQGDPRLSRVGRVIRKLQIDELPQFLNVLVGHMSVVGPRPSPHSENQYSPAWREARLSVKAGITGLWQVKRTRQEGLDFQEWIRFDLEYVRTRSFRLDLWIILRTIQLVFTGRASR